jgi:pimeloyl-ACP methyl ester carboxylesterase
MLASLPAVCALALALPPVETAFVQVAPAYREAAACQRSPGQARAVVLIHGLLPHPFSRDNVARPLFHEWQKPASLLVKRLGKDSDVFAFAYGQNACLSDVVEHSGLAADVARLRKLGYREIVLLGHSAGGLVARQFVEDEPDAGVTKVVQVCSPNGGSSWAGLKVSVRVSQRPFLESLTKEARLRWLADRRDKRVPAGVQFVCVVGTGLGQGDGLVSTRSAWPEDLQRQGIPAFTLRTQHLSAVRGEEGAKLVAEVVRQDQPRWDTGQVESMRRRLFGVAVAGH